MREQNNMSVSGFRNEKRIVAELDNKNFNSLSSNFQNMVLFLCPKVNHSEIINASVIGGTCKADIKITVSKKDYFVSIKKGSGNSVHQEPVNDFVNYISTKCTNYTSSIGEDIAHFIWGDGTLDGLGDPKNRLDAREYKKKHPEKLNNLILFFSNNMQSMLARILMHGSSQSSPAEFLYYGDDKAGVICRISDAITFLSKSSCNSAINLGGLSTQAWNRNIKGGKSEHKRGQIQFKWGGLKNDISKI